VWWLGLRVTLEKSKECQIFLYCATDNYALPQIYLKWKFLYANLCQNLQYFCNSDTKIKLRHQKGVDCTFFGIFSELLRGTAKFWGSKNENIAFLSDWLMPIFSFTLKGSISAVSDLLGHFFQCQKQISKTGGLWLSATVTCV
jgi:hypothetical protein